MSGEQTGFDKPVRNILEYLGSLRLLSSDLDVTITTAHYSGVVNVRKGRVVAASQGELSGNGALFTLATQQQGTIKSQRSIIPVSRDVTVNHDQLVQVCRNFSTATGVTSDREEGRLLDDAVHLFLQFRRKEAAAKLVEILRSNRFYYPAWLWHSRLVTRVDFLTKALHEMKKWGGHFPAVQKEVQKIKPMLADRKGMLKRCIFCYAIVEDSQKECANCHCQLTIGSVPGNLGKQHRDLLDSLCRYEEEFGLHPDNSRIAYCLCLGKFSLGDTVQAKKYLEKALALSPEEQLFKKTHLVLEKVAQKRGQHPVVSLKPAKQQEEEPVGSVVARVFDSPAVKAENGTEPARPIRSQSQSVVGNNRTPTILVIEDSDTSRKVISLVLKRYGYTILEATTGGEGLARMAMAPDLVLLDVMLPDMDGYQVLKQIRGSAASTTVPVVMLSGRRDGADRMRGLGAGANEYLTKPFDPAKLIGVLGQYVKTDHVQPPAPAAAVSAAPAVSMGRTGSGMKSAAQPVFATRSMAANAANAAKKAPQKKAAPTGPSILVVEDSPTTRKVVTMVLEREGFLCREATSGREALASLEQGGHDLVLLDAMLPDMTGYDILLHLKGREKAKDLPVVMLTAKSGAADRQKGLQAGAVEYLTKPFSPDKLLATVKQFLPASASGKLKNKE